MIQVLETSEMKTTNIGHTATAHCHILHAIRTMGTHNLYFGFRLCMLQKLLQNTVNKFKNK
jgi:hypothetical protein